jgi:hypothetical protein
VPNYINFLNCFLLPTSKDRNASHKKGICAHPFRFGTHRAPWIRDGFVVRESGRINVEKSNDLLETNHPSGGHPHRAENDPALRELTKRRTAIEVAILRAEYEERAGILIPV